MKKFFTSSINEYEFISNNISYVFEQYAQIHQFIKSNFPEQYHNLLAKPERDNKEINWYSDLEGEIKRIEKFPLNERTNLINVYNARKHEINDVCIRLENSEDFDKQSWADILKSVFNPDNLFLFSNGKEIILVWGIKTNKQKDYTVPFDEYKNSIISAKINEEEFIKEIDTEEILKKEETDIISNEDEHPTNELLDQEIKSEEIYVPTTINDDNKNIIQDSFIEDKTSSETSSNEVKKNKIDNHVIKPKHWFYRALDRFEIFASKYWWIILIFAIILLWLLLNKCNKTSEQPPLSENDIEEIYDEIMPEIPRKRLIPIDTTDFREDGNTGNVIVAGLVNIAMVEKKEKFKRMAVELKQQFPEEKYKIVYYDEETNRLQFKFPEEETNEIKDKIRSKLSKHKLLIWDESIFMTSKKSNDPFFKNDDKVWHMKSIGLEKAWDITMGDTSVCIAIIDDGFDLNHQEFKRKKIKTPYNIIQDNKNVFGNSKISHGTHVAGLALANANNNTGASGVAPKCSFMPIQIGSNTSFFTMTDVVDGVLYALNHDADVINMSLGKQFSENLQDRSPSELENIINTTGKDEEKFWKELFTMAEKKNILIVLAAGNENLLIGLDPMQRSEQVVKVVAVDKSLEKAEFSNYCKACSSKNTFISAPGVNIFSSIPGNNYESMNGTSMSAPIVTGAIALMKSVNPNLKNKEILKILRQTSKNLADKSCPPFLQLDAALKKIKNN